MDQRFIESNRADMHVLIASNDDVPESIECARTGQPMLWLVPKTALAGEPCILSHWKMGLYATATLVAGAEAAQDQSRKGVYQAEIADIDLLGEALPHSVVAECFPDWKWPTYPKSKTTVPAMYQEELMEVLTDFIDVRSLDVDETVCDEGAARLRLHMVRERDGQLAERKKSSEMLARGRLACEVCSFDFFTRYGDLGAGFCEVHHLNPLSARVGSESTSLDELAVVCSNCHRMLHRRGLLSVQGLAALIDA